MCRWYMNHFAVLPQIVTLCYGVTDQSSVKVCITTVGDWIMFNIFIFFIIAFRT